MGHPFGLSAQDLYEVALAKDNCTVYRDFLSHGLSQPTEEKWSEELRQQTAFVGITVQLSVSALGIVLSLALKERELIDFGEYPMPRLIDKVISVPSRIFHSKPKRTRISF